MGVRVRGFLLALAIAAPGLAIVPGGAAQGPGRNPDLFRSIIRNVAAGDVYDVDCSGATGAEGGSYVVFFVIASRDGASVAGGQGEAGWGYGYPTVHLRVADAVEAGQQLPHLDLTELGPQHWTGTVTSGDQSLRVVWAAWDTPFVCDVTVNGIALSSTSLDNSKAVQARLHDFSGAASTDATLIGAGVDVTFQRNVDGFIYSWLWSEGSIHNTGPNGEAVTSSTIFWVGKSRGTWSHKIDRGYAIGSPRGFILETPI